MSRSGGFSLARLGRMSHVMRGYVERGEVPGIVTLLSRHDEVHVEAIGVNALDAETPIRRDTIFRIASMTKPITAVAAMILVEACRLRLDDPVDPWLPEFANRRVLRGLGSPLDDTVPANRPTSFRREPRSVFPGTYFRAARHEERWVQRARSKAWPAGSQLLDQS